LDADHENHGAARELAGGVARRRAALISDVHLGTYETAVFAALGREDFEGSAGRDFYRWRFV